jgi:hypothetical protein
VERGMRGGGGRENNALSDKNVTNVLSISTGQKLHLQTQTYTHWGGGGGGGGERENATKKKCMNLI